MSDSDGPVVEVNPALSPEENFVALLNKVSRITLGLDDIRIGTIIPNPNGDSLGATRIIVWPRDVSTYRGYAQFFYQRLELDKIIEKSGVDVAVTIYNNDTLASIAQRIGEKVGMIPDQFVVDVDSVDSLRGENQPDSFQIKAINDSIVYVGLADIPLNSTFEGMFKTTWLNGFAYADAIGKPVTLKAS